MTDADDVDTRAGGTVWAELCATSRIPRGLIDKHLKRALSRFAGGRPLLDVKVVRSHNVCGSEDHTRWRATARVEEART